MRQVAAEKRLIERLRASEPEAARELAVEYGPMIQQLAFRYTKNWEDAQEVAQDVLLKAVRKIELFRGDSALSSWLYRITFNTAMSRLRNGRFSRPAEVLESDLRTDAGPSRVFDVPDWSGMGDEAVLRRQLRQVLVRALGEMPRVYRIPVVLRDIQGFVSFEEASRVLRVKSQTLKSRLHRGRLFLRQRLAEFSGGLSLHNTAEA